MKISIISKLIHIANQLLLLRKKYIVEAMFLNYLSIFSQSEEEFNELINLAKELGDQIGYSNGPVFQLKETIKTEAGDVEVFRIRKPDQSRPQLGCGDFEVTDWNKFKNEILNQEKPNIKLIIREKYQMIEIQDKEFDVRLYVPSHKVTDYLNI